jgi:solute carrier family 25 aspartate/glutamate transporter 12/13
MNAFCIKLFYFLHNLFAIIFVFSVTSFRRPTGSELNVPTSSMAEELRSTNPDHIGGYQVALPILSGIETKFGLCLPKFKIGVASV